MAEKTPYDDHHEFPEEERTPNPIRRIKPWIPMLLGILLLAAGTGLYFFIKSPTQAMKRLQTLAEQQEVSQGEAIKGGKDTRLLLDTRDYKNANFLMDMLEDPLPQPPLKAAILKEVNESNQKFIRYDTVMKVYLAELSSEVDEETIRVLSLNSPLENEQLFLKNTADLVHQDEAKLLKLILKYKKNNVGALVQIYELDLDLKYLAEMYSKKELSREDFKRFIRGRNTQEVIAVFYHQAKKSLEEGDYDFVRALAAEPAQLAILVTAPYDQGFALIQNLLADLEQLEQLKAQRDQIQSQISSGEPALTQQKEVTEAKKAEYETQAAQLKKVQSSLGQYAPFELSGKIVKVLGKEKTSYGEAQTYEGAYIRYNFFGEVLSTERFLLRTYKSNLKKNDKFALEVMDSGTLEIKQENLVSTYQQRWPVYDEFTQEMKDNVSQLAGSFQEAEGKTREMKALYDEEDAKLQTLLKEKAVWEEKMQQIQGQIEKLTKEAEELRVKAMAIN